MTNAYEVTPDDVLEVLEERTELVLSTAEVEERLHEKGAEISRPTVLRRLQKLQDKDEIESKTIGQITVWWVKGDGILRDAEEILKSDGGSKLDDGNKKPEGVEKWEQRFALFAFGATIGGTGFAYFAVSDFLIQLPFTAPIAGISGLLLIICGPAAFVSLIGAYLKQRDAIEDTSQRLREIRNRMTTASKEQSVESPKEEQTL